MTLELPSNCLRFEFEVTSRDFGIERKNKKMNMLFGRLQKNDYLCPAMWNDDVFPV